MRNRQLCAVTLAAASVPALLYLPRLGWVWATAAAAISALLLGLCGRRCAPGGLTEVIPAAFGRAGRAVLALVLLGGSLLLGGAARALCAIYPESRGEPLTGLLLLLAAAYAAERGEETVLRSGAILFFFLTAVEAVILGFSAVQVRAAWLAPQTGRVPFAAMTAALSPMAVLYVRGGARRTGGWLAAGIGLCAAAALCAAGTLSPRVAGEEAFAVYTMAKSVSVFGVMERLEPVVSAALTAGGFCLLSVLCLANAKTARAIGWKRRSGIGNFLLGCTGYLAGTVLPEGVQALAAAICWGIVPLVTLWVASVKKLQKNQKNA